MGGAIHIQDESSLETPSPQLCTLISQALLNQVGSEDQLPHVHTHMRGGQVEVWMGLKDYGRRKESCLIDPHHSPGMMPQGAGAQ
jgi:hypothetical protein